MSTRLYIDPTAIPYTPATIRGAWDATGTPSTGKLTLVPTGANTSISKTETNATNNYDVLYGRWVSDGLLTAKTIAGTISGAIRASEANAAANAFFHLHIFVTVGNSDTVRGTLLADGIVGTEFPVTAASVGFSGVALSSVAAQAGDRIVVELGVQFQNTVTTSYATTIQYGGVATVDTVAGNATAGRPKWIQFSENLPFVPKLSTLTDNFDDGTIDLGVYENWGGANITETAGKLHTVGSTVSGDYFGMDVLEVKDITDDAGFIQLADAGAASAFRLVQPIVVQTPNGDNSAYWNIQNGVASCTANVLGSFAQVGTNLTYNSAVHKWFRIRETAGTLYFEWATIGDGSDWTVHASTATPFHMAAVLVSIGTVGNEGGTAPAASYADFDNLNIAAAGATTTTTTTASTTTTTTTTASSTGKIKVYNGSAFVAKPVKVWNGSAWVVKPIKRWNGSAWVATNY